MEANIAEYITIPKHTHQKAEGKCCFFEVHHKSKRLMVRRSGNNGKECVCV